MIGPMSQEADIFDKERLPQALDEYLRSTNPWWIGKPGKPLPSFRRWAFEKTKRSLIHGPTSVTVIRGPRQVGKTTLQEQIIHDLITSDGVDPRRILRVQFDDIPSMRLVRDPVLSITRWFERRILGKTFNESAHASQPAFLLFDEVQNQRDWSEQIKALVDHHKVCVLITGSSALRIQVGRESLAGRVAQIELGTLRLREIAGLRYSENLPGYLHDNGLEPLLQPEVWRGLAEHGSQHAQTRDRAFAAFSERGGYPFVQTPNPLTWNELAESLNETVVKRAIQHDLRVGERGVRRDEQLLELVFKLACRYAGQVVSPDVFLDDVRETLRGNVGWKRLLNYLTFLDASMLIKLIMPAELRIKRRRGQPKVCLCDPGLRASWLTESVPLDPALLADRPEAADLAGRIAESVLGYFLSGIPHLGVTHFPPKAAEPEVDFVLTIGDRRIPVECKYRNKINHDDTRGLRWFIEKTSHNASFGILVTQHENVRVDDPRVIALSLRDLLLLR
jgi:predicted AAA+ superfamily ATPase